MNKNKLATAGKILLIFAAITLVIGLFLLTAAITSQSWSGLFYLFFAIIFGIAFLISGILGLVFKLVGRNQQSTREPRKTRVSVIISIFSVVVVVAIFTLTFTAPVNEINANYAKLNFFRETLPNTLKITQDELNPIRFCSHLSENCNTEATLVAVPKTEMSKAELCKAMIAWTKANDAKYWYLYSNPIKIEDSETQELFSCLAQKLSEIRGATWTATNNMNDDSKQFIAINSNAGPEYSGETPKTYSEYQAFANAEPVQKSIDVHLNAVGQWRKDHPKENPTSKQSVAKALKGLRADLHLGQDGQVAYISYPSPADTNQSVCLSVKKYDETYFGIPDPGANYIVREYFNYPSGEIQFADWITCDSD
jgi:hypothetical protein